MFLTVVAHLALTNFAPSNQGLSGWELRGTAHVRGADQPFEFKTAGDGRFRNSIHGALPDISGFDGENCWVLGSAGFPHTVVQEDRDLNRLSAWVLDGELAISPNVKISPLGKDSISVRFTDGCITATIALDPTTHQPHTLSYWTAAGDEVWTYTNYKSFGTRTFATHIGHKVGGQDEWLDVKSAVPAKVQSADFSRPKPNFTDTKFDSSAPNSVEVKTIFGYTFVHPLVNGQDVGWFFLDTGAGAMCIDPAVAKKLNLPQVGTTMAAGVVASVESPICRAKEFRLGPVTMSSPTFIGLDLGPIGKVFKLDVAGICGFDFLSRVSLALDTKTPTLLIYKPGEVPLPADAKWTHFDFSGELMSITCKFEGDHEGRFIVDTGSGSAVDFMTPAVEKFGLLKGRKSSTVRVGGAGGSGSSQVGKLEWFDIGGNHLTDLTAGFNQTKKGAFASPYVTGNIGAGILGRFKLILDYQNEHIAFAPLSPEK